MNIGEVLLVGRKMSLFNNSEENNHSLPSRFCKLMPHFPFLQQWYTWPHTLHSGLNTMCVSTCPLMKQTTWDFFSMCENFQVSHFPLEILQGEVMQLMTALCKTQNSILCNNNMFKTLKCFFSKKMTALFKNNLNQNRHQETVLKQRA